MHSLSSYKNTVTSLQAANYQTINLFLDNDQSGVDVAFRFLREVPNTVNQSDLFHPHEDLNAFLLSAANVSPLPKSSEGTQRSSRSSRAAQAASPPPRAAAQQLGELKKARALETQLQTRLREQTEEICRAVFLKHAGAKATAFKEATNRTNAGYQANRSIAENMANNRFRAAFIRIVQEQYPAAFKEVEQLEQEILRVQQLIRRLSE
jgi:hypothetical protein